MTRPRADDRAETGWALGLEKLPGVRRTAMPGLKSPQLATLMLKAPPGDEWLHEVKFDGYRLTAVIADGTVRLYTRYGNDWTGVYPGVARALTLLPVGRAVLDGEMIAPDERGVSNFQALQNARGDAQVLLVYYLFDLLYCEGFDLTQTPLVLRKSVLKKLCDRLTGQTEIIRFSDHIAGHGREFQTQACAHGLEGVMSKRADSRYGHKRSKAWVKTKCSMRQEFVIGGYTAPAGTRQGFGALLLGVRDNGRLVYCGRVGTGFSDRDLPLILKQLEDRVQSVSPFEPAPSGREIRGLKHWLRPELVAEVEFASWTDDAILRHPSFKGLRLDKDPRDVHRERPGG